MTRLPADFTGLVRLFPLPNVVLFPHVVQPLHIFEPRYCDMIEEALATDQLLTMALLKPGWEGEYEGRPELEDVACVGRIVSHTRLPENRHNVLLLGLARVRLEYELPVSAAFRRARVEVLQSTTPTGKANELAEMRTTLMDLFRRLVTSSDVQDQLEQLLSQDLSLGTLTDIVAFSTGLEPAVKQCLLAETNIDRRARLLFRSLGDHLGKLADDSSEPRDFPPEFSVN